MPSRRTPLHASIDKARNRGYPVTIEEETWIANPRLAAFYLLRTERTYKAFSQLVMERYVTRKQEDAEV